MKKAEILPKNFRKYFWEYRNVPLNMKEDIFLITERILKFGNQESLGWLLKNISETVLKNVLSKSRNLDAKTQNYWKVILND